MTMNQNFEIYRSCNSRDSYLMNLKYLADAPENRNLHEKAYYQTFIVLFFKMFTI